MVFTMRRHACARARPCTLIHVSPPAGGEFAAALALELGRGAHAARDILVPYERARAFAVAVPVLGAVERKRQAIAAYLLFSVGAHGLHDLHGVGGHGLVPRAAVLALVELRDYFA